MKKKIVLMGLGNYENMGDRIIGKTVGYLVEELSEEYECFFVNFQPERSGPKYEQYKKRRKLVENHGLGQVEHKLIYQIMKDFVQEYYEENLKDADALIFVCGSFKYGTQNLWTTYSLAVECAEKYNVPVMFDAMNIQDYKEEDWRCKCLTEHANYNCVKMISSRDGEAGVRKLKEFYIKNENIMLRSVGDPAFWVKECYAPKISSSNIIGINLIRSGIFSDYSNDIEITGEQQIAFYCDIISELENSKEKWELFTNGMKKDEDFGKIVLEKCGLDLESYLIKVPKIDSELVDTISGYKAIIGARLHACITAYSLDIPFAGFYWDEKMIHFAKETKTEEKFCGMNEFDGKRIVKKLKESMVTPYDDSIKEEWKLKTKHSIYEFLSNSCK